MEHAQTLLTLACIFGFFMAWGIGANDVANAVGTAVGSKALTIRDALLVAAIFEVMGSILAGGQVADTIRSQIIDPQSFANAPELLVYGMLASLLAAGTWLFVATCYGWPVSTTHSIVGAIIGFALIELGFESVEWSVVINIILSWVVTPVVGGIIGYISAISITRLVFNSDNPLKSGKRYLPFYIFIVALVLSLVTVLVGLKHLNISLSKFESVLAALAFSFLTMLIGYFALQRINEKNHDRKSSLAALEKVFMILLVFTACAMAFAHGSNDIANAIGPLAAVVNIVQSNGDISANSPMPVWILFFGAVGIVTGLATYGHKVIATIGSGITELTPSRGFSASLATAVTVVTASGTGLPISTTHTLVGAILGVGFARGIYAINMRVIASIFSSWIITLPAGAFFAIIYFRIFKFVF